MPDPKPEPQPTTQPTSSPVAHPRTGTPRISVRKKSRADERIDEIDVSPAALAKQLEDARSALAAAQADRDEYLEALKRERAEFTNFRRRTEEQRQRDLGLAGVDLISKVLTLADDFDRAVETRPAEFEGDAWVEGIAAIDRKLRLLLESEGVTQVDASEGTPFDPREHEAVTTVPGTGLDEGLIVGEIRRGYRLRDRVIRPALVAVAAAREDGGSGEAPVERPN